MKFTRVKFSDIPKIYKLSKECEKLNIGWVKNWLQNELDYYVREKDTVFIKVELRKKFVGFCLIRGTGRKEITIALEKEFRNKGYGKKIVLKCMNLVPKKTKKFKAIIHAHCKSRFIFEDIGFRPTMTQFNFMRKV